MSARLTLPSKFELDDAEQPWTFSPNKFDLVHIRNLAQAISDWPRLLAEAFRCTKPGGYIELSEAGGIFPAPNQPIDTRR